MKNLTKLSHLIFLLFLIGIANLIYAQSDYNLVESFKTKTNEIEDSIKAAESLDACLRIDNTIADLRYNFEEHKILLDKSLYPHDFNGSIAKLSNMLELRKNDFSQINQLQEAVDTLTEKLAVLDRANTSLIARINTLENNQKKNAETIASLEKLTSQLKSNIKLRDMLIVEVADSLLAEYVSHPFSLNEAEKISLAEKIEYHNLFFNIEKTIDDHIEFLGISTIKPEDITDMKKGYTGFLQMWEKVGAKLADIYLVKKEKKEKIESINNKFAQWNSALNNSMWAAVDKVFKEKNIRLMPYTDGKQFTNRVTEFIDKEIEKADTNNSDEVEETYFTFADSVWYNNIENEWMPVLIENNMLTKADKDTIEKRLTVWKAQVIQEGLEWWVYAVGVLILIGIVMVSGNIFRKKQAESE